MNVRRDVLFVCRENIGRSQVAMSFHNALVGDTAMSAGTAVDIPGQTISERPEASTVISAMLESGLDIAHNVRTQLEPEMLAAFGRVVVLSEEESIPRWLKLHRPAEFWYIRDLKGLDLADTRIVRDEIRDRVHGMGR